MKCPHCTIHFHDNWIEHFMEYHGVWGTNEIWKYRVARCPRCEELTIEVGRFTGERIPIEWRQVHPRGSSRGPVPPEVPPEVAADYVEACLVLPQSAKASAALARRCLQTMLHAHGYKDRDLAKEIDQLLNEPNPRKALPHAIHTSVDAIRNFGNFSAHPIDDKTSLQVIDVEPHEAEWCLQILEDLFEHFYVGPALAATKKQALDAKLKAAGKPASK